MSKIAHGRKRALELYGRASDLTSPAVAWNASQFKSVDDRVRGGSSQSRVEVTSSEDGADGRGELKFSGFLGKQLRWMRAWTIVEIAAFEFH